MPAFGLTLQASPAVAVPDGYAAGTVSLGDEAETVLMNTELWSPADYLAHWKDAAAEVLHGKKPALFCSDYGPNGCTCFIAWPEGLNATFQQWVLRPADVVVDGHVVRLVAGATMNEGASHWHVPLSAIQTFAHQ